MTARSATRAASPPTTMPAAIRDAVRDTGIKAILLRVDSPGGSVSASDQILHAVEKARKAGKPVVVSMATLAASAAIISPASPIASWRSPAR